MTFFGSQEVFPLEENVSNRGEGCGPKGVVPDTPFVSSPYPRLEPSLGGGVSFIFEGEFEIPNQFVVSNSFFSKFYKLKIDFCICERELFRAKVLQSSRI